MVGEPVVQTRLKNLPDRGEVLLDRWRGLRDAAGGLPLLHDLAPTRLPPALVPWSMNYRRSPSRELTYGVVGEELIFLFQKNPRGQPVLNYAANGERDERYAMIHRSLDTCCAFWFLGAVLFEDCSVDFGRLCLPTRLEAGEALLLVYFPMSPVPDPRPRLLAGGRGLVPLDVVWIDG